MPNTYVWIQTATVSGGGQGTLQFTNIPQTYTDLLIFGSVRDSRTNDATNYTTIQLNGSTTTSWLFRGWSGQGSNGIVGAEQGSGSNGVVGQPITIPTNMATSNSFSNWSLLIPNYTSTNNKALIAESGNESIQGAMIGTSFSGIYYQLASAITSIQFGISFTGSGGGTYQTNSSITLYGIKNA